MAKPTLEELWNSDFFQKHIAGAVTYATQQIETEIMCEVESNISGRRGPLWCDSPLEAAFLAWWYALARVNQIDGVWVVPQKEITCGGQLYRLDFQVVPVDSGTASFKQLSGHPLCPRIAIELDGHDFHERTKEQVTWRNQRDRALAADGWHVWHFSGSEFHRDPRQVVWQAVYLGAISLFSQAMRKAGFWENLDPVVKETEGDA